MKGKDRNTLGFGDRFRMKRRAAAQDLFPSTTLFIAGIITMPALLFNPSTILRTFQFLLFLFYAWSVGKRTSFLNTLIVTASIVGFNLLVPYGRVLATIGTFKLTQGALLAGIEKAVTVEGLIMLSKSTVRSDLRLPGRFGELIGESFRYFELIMERRAGIDRKDPIGGVDRLLVELSGSPEGAGRGGSGPMEAKAPRHAILGRAILAAAVALAWSPILLVLIVR